MIAVSQFSNTSIISLSSKSIWLTMQHLKKRGDSFSKLTTVSCWESCLEMQIQNIENYIMSGVLTHLWLPIGAIVRNIQFLYIVSIFKQINHFRKQNIHSLYGSWDIECSNNGTLVNLEYGIGIFYKNTQEFIIIR